MEQDEHGNWHIKVPLKGETKRLLEELVNTLGDVTPTDLAGSLLHDLLEDDAEAHLSPEDFRPKGTKLH